MLWNQITEAGNLDLLLRAWARKTLPPRLRQAVKRWRGTHRSVMANGATSRDCELLPDGDHHELLRGWQDPDVAERQDAAFAPLLQRMREGKPRQDFVALAKAIKYIGEDNPLIIEIGCGSAWNVEVLSHLWRRPFRYIGMDYSAAMILRATRRHPRRLYVIGEATALPFRSRSCDVLLSGTVLMHLLGYARAIQESRRVTRKWCVFHTIPIVRKRSTTILKKLAYGSPVVEVVFNPDEFESFLEREGLIIRAVLNSIPHEYLNDLLSEAVTTQTYVCEAT
jgi:ubiquinone/menaquinone biosynthesis C-methylase UbiE